MRFFHWYYLQFGDGPFNDFINRSNPNDLARWFAYYKTAIETPVKESTPETPSNDQMQDPMALKDALEHAALSRQ